MRAWKNNQRKNFSSGPLVVTFSSPHCLFWIIKVPPGRRPSSSPEHRAKSANSMLPRKPTLDAAIGVYTHCLFYSLPSKSSLALPLCCSPGSLQPCLCFGDASYFQRQVILVLFLPWEESKKIMGQGCSRVNGRETEGLNYLGHFTWLT